MVIIGCGLMLTGLIAGALFGCIWVSLGIIGIGCILAAAGSWIQHTREQAVLHRKLAQYPPYGY